MHVRTRTSSKERLEHFRCAKHCLNLPSHIRCFDVFNVKHLLPYHGDSSDDDLVVNSRENFIYPWGNDAGPSIEEWAILFLDAQDRTILVLVLDVEQEHNLICLIGNTADETSQLDLNIHSDDHVQDQNSAYQDMDKDSNIHCKDHVEEQNSLFQDMDKESHIHSHDNVEQQNSLNMCKEHVLAEFDAIKATIDIIDKRKGEVSTSCLEKELDIVKDRIAVLEKCFKLRYHDTSEDSVKQVCYKPHDFHYSKSDSAVSDVFHQEVASEKRDWTGKASSFIYAESQDKYSVSQLLQLVSNEKSSPVLDCTQLEGSVGFNKGFQDRDSTQDRFRLCKTVIILRSGSGSWLDPSCKDDQLNDSVLIGLGKPVDMMRDEVNKSNDKLGETLHVGVIVDCATLQSSPPPNAMDHQDPQPTNKVTAEVFVVVQVDHVLLLV
ncbi:hypothetical protein Tco_1047965 [Tanacetum coccineum]